MMGKNKSISDLAAVQRASLDKMWKWHWARSDLVCEACGSKSSGIAHPIWRCKHEDMIEYRLRWRKNVWMFIEAAKPNERPQFEELWRNMETAQDGAYAACGVFLPGFLDKLTRADQELTKAELQKLNRFLKEIGKGARQILKIHRELSEMKVRTELYQTSIKSFLEKKRVDLVGGDCDCEDEDRPQGKKNKIKKRKGHRSIYVNPGRESDSGSDSDSEGTPRIKNPPSPSTVLRKFFVYNIEKGPFGGVIYWEWKAG
jgi:hypothetical protein